MASRQTKRPTTKRRRGRKKKSQTSPATVAACIIAAALGIVLGIFACRTAIDKYPSIFDDLRNTATLTVQYSE